MILEQIGSQCIQGINCPVMTWSKSMKDILEEFSSNLSQFKKPCVLKFDESYTKTFTLNLSDNYQLTKSDIVLIDSFNSILLNEELYILKGLITDKISFNTLHYFFSYLHDIMSIHFRSKVCTLYAPLGETGETGFEFPPHFDLYAQKMLLLIYNDISHEAEGNPTLLSIKKFKSILESHDLKGKDIILKTISKELETDHYDLIINTLYSDENMWIKDVLFEESIKLPVKTGDGFICNDRKWLHGRQNQKYHISQQRLIRFVFN